MSLGCIFVIFRPTSWMDPLNLITFSAQNLYYELTSIKLQAQSTLIKFILKKDVLLDINGLKSNKICFYNKIINLLLDMTTMKFNRSASQIQTQLNQTNRQMIEMQQKGDYVQAQNCRILIEQLKKCHEERRVYEMEQRHQHQNEERRTNYQNQYTLFFNLWEKTIYNHKYEGDNSCKQMELRHNLQLQSMKKELEEELPLKVKESCECLNLRKMEDYMAKQKNFVEAHNAQQRIAELVVIEKQKWMTKRNKKIETVLKTQREKQEIQLSNLKKKIKTALDELIKQRKKQEEKLNLKYENIQKQQKMQQQKEKLAYTGQSTSKGGQGSPMLTKSKFFSKRQ